ncbi:MAG: hypothetical protein QM737_10060 [Ferruginibacter sp.]
MNNFTKIAQAMMATMVFKKKAQPKSLRTSLPVAVVKRLANV